MVPENSQTGKYLSISAFIISIAALAINFLNPYFNSLKSFDLEIRVSPNIGMHRFMGENLGIYLDLYMNNKSPKYGLITDACIILNHAQSPEDKYLLKFASFRVMDSTKQTYIESEERLPFLFRPWQGDSKIFSFVYDKSEEFPISMGKFNCELLIWINDNTKADYSRSFRFQITDIILKEYNFRKEYKSSTIQWIQQIGYTPLESKKLSAAEYQLLK